MASTEIYQTVGSTTENKIFTFSAWVKRGGLSAYQTLIQANGDPASVNYINAVQFTDSDQIRFIIYHASTLGEYITNAVYRDTSAWYHIVLSVDTTQATASNRVKLYVNGEEVTSFATETDPSQNQTLQFNTVDSVVNLGSRYTTSGSNQFFNGSMAHVHYIDGTAYDASAFGETDATSGIWVPKPSPSVTYGTNGFFLKFGNAGSLGTDSSGNANNFTVSGSGTQTLDTPSNVFATWNPLFKSDLSYSNGNLSTGNTTASHNTTVSTLAVTKGKWYWEVKHTQLNSSNKVMVGILGIDNGDGYTDFCGNQATGYGYYSENGSKYNNASPSSYAASYTAGDIISVAFDADNGTLWYGKNGTWLNSATQTEIENGTTTNAAFSGIDTSIGFYAGCSNEDCNSTANFGNGYFGTTAVSTPESDSAGLGKFEYSVPSGYYALCTKNIADYG